MTIDIDAANREIAAIRAAMPRGSILSCDVNPNELHLKVIRVFETGQGAGTRAMQSLIALCDRHELAIVGTVDPTDDPDDPNTQTLLRWYQGLGFRVDGVDEATDAPLIRRDPGARPGPRPLR